MRGLFGFGMGVVRAKVPGVSKNDLTVTLEKGLQLSSSHDFVAVTGQEVGHDVSLNSLEPTR